jgi:purine-binding chemotaxis protein CheW
MKQEKSSKDSGVASSQGREGKYLTFALGEEEFGIAILKVKEIIGLMPFTSVPRTPGFVKGVINLRGKVIPVIDLRLKFDMDSRPYGERTCIIVVEARQMAVTSSMGLVVDAVNEVVNIQENQVEQPPSFGVSLDTDFILGMAKVGESVRILLDIDRVLTEDELSRLSQAA